MTGPPAPVVDALVANHRRFLAFLERRVGNRADAEDILQAAFVRALERGGALREDESAVAWFYRLLRNALADYYRAREVGDRAHARLKAMEPERQEPDTELKDEVCRCVTALLPALKSEYADILRQADLEEAPVATVAGRLGITANNAAVRLHRARTALLREVQRSCGTCAAHGCLDCSCGGRV